MRACWSFQIYTISKFLITFIKRNVSLKNKVLKGPLIFQRKVTKCYYLFPLNWCVLLSNIDCKFHKLWNLKNVK